MIRSLLALTIGIAAGVGVMAAAYQHEDGESVKLIDARDIKEKVDGKDAKEVAIPEHKKE